MKLNVERMTSRELPKFGRRLLSPPGFKISSMLSSAATAGKTNFIVQLWSTNPYQTLLKAFLGDLSPVHHVTSITGQSDHDLGSN